MSPIYYLTLDQVVPELLIGLFVDFQTRLGFAKDTIGGVVIDSLRHVTGIANAFRGLGCQQGAAYHVFTLKSPIYMWHEVGVVVTWRYFFALEIDSTSGAAGGFL